MFFREFKETYPEHDFFKKEEFVSGEFDKHAASYKL